MKRTLLFSALALPVLLAVYSLTTHEATTQASSAPAAQPVATQGRISTPMIETASLPALDYAVPDARKRFVRGAITYYPAQISEANALEASAEGRSLEVTTPDGSRQRFEFERMAEAIDGNWSWVGRSANGMNALFTFGANNTAFGRIDVPGRAPFRVTTENGQTWVTEADPSRAAVNQDDWAAAPSRNPAANVTGAAAAVSADTPHAPSMAASQAGLKQTPTATAAELPTIDVLVAYTQMVEDRYRENDGAGAVTYITYILELGNQALANSKIPYRYRLVGTKLVDYDDDVVHETAVDDLTNGNGVMAELHTLRNTLGADLVSLVRVNNDDHWGCGYAWVPGADASGQFLVSDEYLGFSSVGVSDDRDGWSYCYEETLAHELGHNLGQAHENGGMAGTHTYSYGYREASPAGFHTIMAYADQGYIGDEYFWQYSVLHYANPNVREAATGRVTGTTKANNFRSMKLTMPVAAKWRTVPAPTTQATAAGTH